MKLRFSALAAAFFAAFVACNPVTVTETITFQVSTVDTKTALDGTKFCFEPGDVLFFSTDQADATVIDGSIASGAKIELTQAMIGEDGKTATFTLEGVSSAANFYFLYAVGKRADIISGISAQGVAAVSAIDQTGYEENAPEIAYLGAASCIKGNNKFTLNNVLVPVRFKIPEDAYKVTLEAADGSVVAQDFTVRTNGQVTLLESNQKTKLTAVLDKRYHDAYFFLTPGIKINGYKLTVYSDNTTTMYESESADVLEAVGGYQLNLGTIKKSGVQYAKVWEEGKAITIGDKVYSKAASGLTAIHLTLATHGPIYVIPEGLSNTILFVDSDVQVTINTASTVDNVVIVGNKEGVRSEFNFASKYLFAYTNLAFKNMKLYNMTDTAINNVSKEFELALDACWFTVQVQLLCPAKWEHPSNAMKSFVIVDSDWEITAKNQRLVNMAGDGGSAPTANFQGYFIFKNNVIYNSQSGLVDAEFMINSFETTYTRLVVENNTWLNVGNKAGNAGFFAPKNVSQSISSKNNLIYIDGSLQDIYANDNSHHFVICRINGSSPSASSIDVGAIEGDMSQGNYLYQTYPEYIEDKLRNSIVAVFCAGGVQYGWGAYRTENPFSYVSPTTGKFITLDQWASYGAKRDN